MEEIERELQESIRVENALLKEGIPVIKKIAQAMLDRLELFREPAT